MSPCGGRAARHRVVPRARGHFGAPVRADVARRRLEAAPGAGGGGACAHQQRRRQEEYLFFEHWQKKKCCFDVFWFQDQRLDFEEDYFVSLYVVLMFYVNLFVYLNF